MKNLGLSILVAFLLTTTIAWSVEVIDDTATLSWSAPTTNIDGSVLTDLAGYKVYHRKGTTYSTAGQDAGDVTGIQFVGLSEGEHCFVVTAYDTSGNESVYSNEVCKTINFTPPDTTPPDQPVDVVVK